VSRFDEGLQLVGEASAAPSLTRSFTPARQSSLRAGPLPLRLRVALRLPLSLLAAFGELHLLLGASFELALGLPDVACARNLSWLRHRLFPLRCAAGAFCRSPLPRRRSALLRKPSLDGPLVLWHRLVAQNSHCPRIGVQHVKARGYAIAEQRGPGPPSVAAESGAGTTQPTAFKPRGIWTSNGEPLIFVVIEQATTQPVAMLNSASDSTITRCSPFISVPALRLPIHGRAPQPDLPGRRSRRQPGLHQLQRRSDLVGIERLLAWPFAARAS